MQVREAGMLLPLEHILPETITLIAYPLIIKENILIEDGSGPGACGPQVRYWRHLYLVVSR